MATPDRQSEEHDSFRERLVSERLQLLMDHARVVAELEAGTSHLRAELDRTQSHYEAAERDRGARLRVIEEQGRRLGEIEAERNNLRAELLALQSQFAAAEADRAARLDVIEQRGKALEELRAECEGLQAQAAELAMRLNAVAGLMNCTPAPPLWQPWKWPRFLRTWAKARSLLGVE